ncbi:MAG: TetR/AcrR family transcriptional regulator [Actinomycetaceae bacterium]|nr:TetR/AcrR family transcriptional regulator [Actinomycetaceae bacterium]
MSNRQYRRSGPRPSFDRDDIVNAAIEQGLTTFTMTSVARALNVSHPALYREVSSRHEIVMLAVERLVGLTQWPDPSLHWREAFSKIAHTIWDACDTYSGLDITILTTPGISGVAAKPLTSIAQALAPTPMGWQGAKITLEVIIELTLAAHIAVEAVRSTVEVDGKEKSGAEIQKQAWEGKVSADQADMLPQEAWLDNKGNFEEKLEIFLDGIGAKYGLK